MDLRCAPWCKARVVGTALTGDDRITDADHGWPGEDDVDGLDGFASTRRTWSFLARYRRN